MIFACKIVFLKLTILLSRLCVLNNSKNNNDNNNIVLYSVCSLQCFLGLINPSVPHPVKHSGLKGTHTHTQEFSGPMIYSHYCPFWCESFQGRGGLRMSKFAFYG